MAAQSQGYRRDARCFVHPAAKLSAGTLRVCFTLKKGEKGEEHAFPFGVDDLAKASPEQWREFERLQILPWLAAHEKFCGRDTATSGALLRHNPNGFVCVHGTETEMCQLAALRQSVPGDNIHMLIPVAVADLVDPPGSAPTLGRDPVSALKPRVAQFAAQLGTDADTTGQPTPPDHFTQALESPASRLKPHGVLLAALGAVVHSGALPARSTHVLLAVSKSPPATHCKLECFGGKRHLGETSQEAALREFEEESGIPQSHVTLQSTQPLLVGLDPMDALFLVRPAVRAGAEEEDAAVDAAVATVAALPKFEASPFKGRRRGKGRRGGRGGVRGRGGGRRRGGAHSAGGGASGAGGFDWGSLGGPSESAPEDR